MLTEMERWSLILAETQDEPSEAFLGEVPGARRVWDRVWLWQDWPAPERERKALPYAESPLYGKVYARFVAKGEGVDAFRSHPLGARIGEAKAREYYRAVLGGSPKAPDLEAELKFLGFQDLADAYREKAQEVRSMQILLSLVGVPHQPGDVGELLIGTPPVFSVSKQEEAEVIARTYRWAREVGCRIRPAPRGSKGELRFYVDLIMAPASDGKLAIPIKASPAAKVFAIRREGGTLVAEGVPIRVPRDVRLIFFPHFG